MKRLIIMAALAVAALGFNEASAQEVIKDASGAVYIDVQDMPAGAFSTSTLNTITLLTAAGNSVYKKLQIAKADMTGLTWAGACGIAASYNSVTAIGQTQGQVSTGCGAYTEVGATSGWRVPTQRELQLMWIMKDALTQAGASAFATNDYWVSNEDTAAVSWCVSISNGRMDNASKTYTNNYTRCVREVN